VGRAGRHPDGEVHHTAAVQGTISGARRGGRTGGASRGDDQNDEETWIIRGKGEDDKEARGSGGSKRNYQTLTVLRAKVTEQEQEINCQIRVKRST
jgi:hypothetical protein